VRISGSLHHLFGETSVTKTYLYNHWQMPRYCYAMRNTTQKPSIPRRKYGLGRKCVRDLMKEDSNDRSDRECPPRISTRSASSKAAINGNANITRCEMKLLGSKPSSRHYPLLTPKDRPDTHTVETRRSCWGLLSDNREIVLQHPTCCGR